MLRFILLSIYKSNVVAMNRKKEERITAYLAKIPPAISGQNGHTQTFHVARILVHGFGLSDLDAMAFLERYSARCVPPWSRRELKHKLASARKSGPGKMQRL